MPHDSRARTRRAFLAGTLAVVLTAACAPGRATPAASPIAPPPTAAPSPARPPPTPSPTTAPPTATPLAPSAAATATTRPTAAAAVPTLPVTPSAPPAAPAAPAAVPTAPASRPAPPAPTVTAPTGTAAVVELKYLWPTYRPAGFAVDGGQSRADATSFAVHLAPPGGGQFYATVVGGGEAAPLRRANGRPVAVRGRPGLEFNTGAGATVYWEEDGRAYGVRSGLSLAEALRVAEGLEPVGLATWRERLSRPNAA